MQEQATSDDANGEEEKENSEKERDVNPIIVKEGGEAQLSMHSIG